MATNISLYERVLTNIRKAGVGSVPPATFLIWVNKALLEVVDNKLASMDVNTRHQDDLLPIHVQNAALTLKVITPPAPAVPVTMDYAELPVNYLRRSVVHLDLSKDGVTYENVRCVYLRDSRRSDVLASVYDRPSTRQSYFSFESNDDKPCIHFYRPTGYAIAASLSYYKQPTLITLTPSGNTFTVVTLPWNESMINEVVNTCTVQYLASITDPRVQAEMAIKQQSNINS